MVRFDLEVASSDPDSSTHGLTRGHMTIAGSKSLATSKERRPDQSMMIFPSIVELLDGVRLFVLDENTDTYHFVGIDSSFHFTISKENDKRVRIVCDQKTVDVVQTTELIQTVWNEASKFVGKHKKRFSSDDIVSNDLHRSIEDFKNSFDIRGR